MQGSATSSSELIAAPIERRTHWHRLALIAFACINVASIGIFFAVFIGVVFAPPNPRNALYALVAGGLALVVLVMGQFVYWSALALRRLKGRRP